jgi:predicted nucleic acid-binding protein
MAVIFDANMLSLLLHQTARLPCAPGTKIPVSRAKERIELLIEDLSRSHETILIPAPVLAEFLVIVEEAGPGYLKTISRKASFEIAPFDEKAAIEAAEIVKYFIKKFGSKRGPDADVDWQRAKVDQQIVAIAVAEGVDCIYGSDRGLLNTATARNVKAVGLWDLPVPPSDSPLIDYINELEARDAETEAKSEPATDRSSSEPTEPEPPAEQLDGADLETSPPPEPARPAAPQAAQAPRPQGSSQVPLKP